jgi:hypothetical protein
LVKLFRHYGDKTEVTEFYLQTLLKALGGEYQSIYSVDEICEGDLVLTSSVLDARRVFTKAMRGTRVINWYQGIYPEEVATKGDDFLKMKFERYLRNICVSFFNTPIKIIMMLLSKLDIHIKYLSYVEKQVLNKCVLNVFVSESMRKHFAVKYGYNKDNFFIMPCFNTVINTKSFEREGKYKKPSFCYIGSMDKWQCFELTVSVFKEIEKISNTAFLKVLTPDIKEGKRILEEYSVKNYEIKHVSKENVGEELSGIKYGFVLREDKLINNVATPTKLSDYLSNGVVPIISDSVSDYYNYFKNQRYFIFHENGMSPIDLAKKILDFDDKINMSAIKEDYNNIFDNYFNMDYYIGKFTNSWMKRINFH